MNCDLELQDGCEGEPIEGYELTIVSSFGIRECYECGRPIGSYEPHELVTGSTEYGPFEAHTCLDCRNIAIAFGNGGRLHGTLWEQMEEYGGENSGGEFEHFNSGCLTKVETASAKAYLVDRYLKWKGLREA